MHKISTPSFLIFRYKRFFLSLIFWLSFWSVAVYLIYRFPYALDVFHFRAATASIIELAMVSILVAVFLGSLVHISDSFVRDKKAYLIKSKPNPVVLDSIFVSRNT